MRPWYQHAHPPEETEPVWRNLHIQTRARLLGRAITEEEQQAILRLTQDRLRAVIWCSDQEEHPLDLHIGYRKSRKRSMPELPARLRMLRRREIRSVLCDMTRSDRGILADMIAVKCVQDAQRSVEETTGEIWAAGGGEQMAPEDAAEHLQDMEELLRDMEDVLESLYERIIEGNV